VLVIAQVAAPGVFAHRRFPTVQPGSGCRRRTWLASPRPGAQGNGGSMTPRSPQTSPGGVLSKASIWFRSHTNSERDVLSTTFKRAGTRRVSVISSVGRGTTRASNPRSAPTGVLCHRCRGRTSFAGATPIADPDRRSRSETSAIRRPSGSARADANRGRPTRQGQAEGHPFPVICGFVATAPGAPLLRSPASSGCNQREVIGKRGHTPRGRGSHRQ
jgi:hypothetical protein